MELDLAVVHQLAPGKAVIPISALDGTGLAELSQEIVSMVFQGEVGAGEAAFVSRVRQVHLLEQAFASLQDAATAISAQLPVDCVVVDLRNAWDKLGEISGDTVGEDLLDQIFSQFCIGK
jgi:tRNA modification GTPase